MASYVVRFRGTRERARAIVRELADAIAGQFVGPYAEPARWVRFAVLVAALSDIKIDYVRKARHSRGEDGVRWLELSPETIARRRVGREDRKDPRIKHRLDIVKQEYRRYLRRYVLSIPEAEAKRRAHQAAEMAATRIMGESKVQTLSARDVEILRDTDLLLGSISPGEVGGSPAGAVYQVPSGEGGTFQDVEIVHDGVTFVTNVQYAETHQKGLGHCPARPFIPDKPPQVWLDRWAAVGGDAIAFVVQYLIDRESGRV